MYVKAVIISVVPLIWSLRVPEDSSIKHDTDANLNIDADTSLLVQLKTNASHIPFQDVNDTGHDPKGVALSSIHEESDNYWASFLSSHFKGHNSPKWKQIVPAIICALALICLFGQCMCQETNSCQEQREDVEVQAPIQPFWTDPLCLRDFEKRTFRKAMPKVALALSVWLIGLYGNNVSQAWLQRNMEGYYETRWPAKLPGDQSLLLWDAGHYFFPVVLAEPWVADVLAQMISTLTFVRFAVLPGPFSMRWTVLRRMFLIWGLLWAFRGIMVISTVLPNPEKTCKSAISFPGNVLLEALANMPFVFWKSELTCHDVIFSGHAVAVTLATMTYLHYDEQAPWRQFQAWPRWLSCCIITPRCLINAVVVANMFLSLFVIINSKVHYTADVLIGFAASALAFQAYHAAVVVAFVPESKPTIVSSSLCPILPLLRWLEEDAVDVASLNSSLLQKPQEVDYFVKDTHK